MFKKFFLFPTILTCVLLSIVFYFLGFSALITVMILIVLEITLSFDNAVVNAKVLEEMNDIWKHRFLTWGIWAAVFGTRVILPIFLVSVISGLSFLNVVNLAIFDPRSYGLRLEESHYSIGAFGGVFLFLVALKFFIDHNKELFWIRRIEKRLQSLANIESISICIALMILLLVSFFEKAHALEILTAGVIGCIIFVLMEGVVNKIGSGLDKTVLSGFGLFMYLNMLDVAFSLDGVVGAFAISSNLIVIAVGLGIGAYFVRVLTLLIVEQKTLSELKYLEHGAHWAIFGLSLCMFLGLVIHIPETVTGLIGLFFIFASYISSKKFSQS